jgi:hypothetical protein
MSVINKIADRMVGLLVPSVTAEARIVCTPGSYLNPCKCHDGTELFQTCTLHSDCTTTCTACNQTSDQKC